MAEIKTDLSIHDLTRVVDCCVCGRMWEERWIGVTLMRGRNSLGSLCPKCVRTPPQAIAGRLRGQAETIRQSVDRWSATSPIKLEDNKLLQSLLLVTRVLVDRSKDLSATMHRSARLLTESNVLAGELREVMAASQQLVDRMRQQRRADAGGYEEIALPSTGNLMVADVLGTLANDFPEFANWPTSVEHMISAETNTFVNKYREFRTFRIREAIENRYQQFLTAN